MLARIRSWLNFLWGTKLSLIEKKKQTVSPFNTIQIGFIFFQLEYIPSKVIKVIIIQNWEDKGFPAIDGVLVSPFSTSTLPQHSKNLSQPGNDAFHKLLAISLLVGSKICSLLSFILQFKMEGRNDLG